MNYIDYLVLAPILYGLYKGFTKGFILELTSLIALIVAIYGASYFSGHTFKLLKKVSQIDQDYLEMASYALTFIGIIIGINLIGKLLTYIVKIVALGFVNRLMGAIFGGVKGLLIITIILHFFNTFNSQFKLINEKQLNHSLIYKPLLEHSQKLYPNIVAQITKRKHQIEETIPVMNKNL
jgi:membrane protein required for colicin V production